MIYAKPGTPDAAIKLKTRYGNYVGGEFVAPVNGLYFTNTSPVDGSLISEFPRSSREDIELALDAPMLPPTPGLGSSDKTRGHWRV